MCVYLPVRDFILFYPSHQPVNILLMQLANTFFACYFFGEKNVVVFFLYSCWLVTWTQLAFCWARDQRKNGETFFLLSSRGNKRMLWQIFFPLQCTVRCIIIAIMVKLPRFFSSFSTFLNHYADIRCRRPSYIPNEIYNLALPIHLGAFYADPFHFMAFYGDMYDSMDGVRACVCADWIYTDGDIETNVSACIAFNSNDTEPKLSSSTNKHQFMSWCFRSMWFWCFWPVDGLAVSFFYCVRECMTCGERCVATNVDVYAYTWFSLLFFFVIIEPEFPLLFEVSKSTYQFIEWNSTHTHTHTNTKSKSNFIASYVAVSFHFHFKAVINGFGLISHTKCAVCQCDLITRVCSFVFSTSDLSIRFLLLTVYSSNSLRFVLYA